MRAGKEGKFAPDFVCCAPHRVQCSRSTEFSFGLHLVWRVDNLLLLAVYTFPPEPLSTRCPSDFSFRDEDFGISLACWYRWHNEQSERTSPTALQTDKPGLPFV